MISIDINHPDVMEFIKIKRDLSQVTGANISIKLNDEFMKAVENDEDYLLRFPCNVYDNNDKSLQLLPTLNYNVLEKIPESQSNGVAYIKKVKAKEYWDEIIKSARDNAEPGLMYWDNIIDYDPATVYEQYRPVTSNPCGEQFLQPNDSCRLMVHRLDSYVENPFTDKAIFNKEHFYKNVYEGTRLGDNLIDLEVEYIQRIIDKIKSDPEPDILKRQELELWEKSKEICGNGRRIGMGITGLGDMLACLNLKYDSNEALSVIDSIMKLKMEAELDCLIDLAILRGTFKGYDFLKEYGAINNGTERPELPSNSFYKFIQQTYPEQVIRMGKYGRRSISWSTIAPTGSVSLLANNCTSGCEPLFQPFYIRRKKVNPGEDVRVDFVDQNGDSWQEFPVLHPKFKEWLEINDNFTGYSDAIKEVTLDKDWLKDCFETSPWYGSTANDIDWVKRIEIQSILQKYTSNAISSTINLPSTVTYEEVSNIYLQGYKLGLKGQTIYVDGSRSGVLVSESKPKEEEFKQIDAPKRPKELFGEAHTTKVRGTQYSVIVGLLKDKPYEVFITQSSIKGEGLIIKQKSGDYDFIQVSNSNSTHKILTNGMTDEQAAITRMVSTSLRHGADIKFIVEQLGKTEGDLFSFTKGLARVLKKYIPNGEKSTIKCNDCGSDNVIFEEGCSKCLDCGSSKCS